MFQLKQARQSQIHNENKTIAQKHILLYKSLWVTMCQAAMNLNLDLSGVW